MGGRDALTAAVTAMVWAIPDGEPIAVRARVYVNGSAVDEHWLVPGPGFAPADAIEASTRQARIMRAACEDGHHVEVEYWFPGHPAMRSAVRTDGADFAAGVPPHGLERG